MKFIYIRSKCRRRGATLLVVAVAVVTAVVIGYAIFKIAQCLTKLNPTISNRNRQIEIAGDEGHSNNIAQLLLEFPGQTISVLDETRTVVTSLVPFDAASVRSTIYRSTNLIDWEFLTTVEAGQSFTVTNMDLPCEFFKQVLSQ